MNNMPIEKIECALTELYSISGNIKDVTVKNQVFKIQDILNRIIDYLHNHPEKASLAYNHIEYYLEKTVLFAKSYIDLEEIMLDTPEVENTKGSLRELFIDFEKAYEIKFTKIISYSLLELNASLAVANDILDENNY